MAIELNPHRIQSLIEEQTESLNARTQKSKTMYERARKNMSGGVEFR